MKNGELVSFFVRNVEKIHKNIFYSVHQMLIDFNFLFGSQFSTHV